MDDRFQNLVPFKKASERVLHEREDRKKKATQILPFGISYLDDAMMGMFPNDVVLFGGTTGLGKTELATQIALHNAREKKNIHFFALEAEPFEIERRIKYRYIAEYFFAYRSRFPGSIHLSFRNWYSAMHDSLFDEADAYAQDETKKIGETLFTYYRSSGDFTVETLSKLVLAVQNQTDLIILDHIHFLDSDDTNENAALKQQIKKIRDDALLLGKPFLILGHLRKPQHKNKSLMADIADFHGSSDLTKMATKVFTINRGSAETQEPNKDTTLFHVAKNRMDGSVTRFAGQLTFDHETRRYADKYILGRVDAFGEKFECIDTENKKPRWALNANIEI